MGLRLQADACKKRLFLERSKQMKWRALLMNEQKQAASDQKQCDSPERPLCKAAHKMEVEKLDDMHSSAKHAGAKHNACT